MSYDRLDRLTEIVAPQGTIGYAYDAIGRRTSLTISGGDVTSYGYDKANRIKSATLRGRSATYAYDAAGRLAQKVLPDGIKMAYLYDAADRVTSMAYSKADDTPIETVTYAYNSLGQRVLKGTSTPGVQDSTLAASYDEANRLTQIILNGETFTLSYDANGNLTSKSGPTSGTTIYTWDARSRLTQIAGPSGTATFTYDALGRRIERSVAAATTGYLYDGAQAIAELKGNAIDTVYHAGLEVDEVLARYGSLGNKTLLTDALRSVIAQAHDDQTVQNFYSYSPYGEVRALGSDDGNPLQYTGRENDGTGLYYYRARYYDPVLKRFLSQDPIGLLGGDTNLYSYVGGNPLSYIDPLGLQSFPGVPANASDLQVLTRYYAATAGIPGAPDPQNMCIDAACRGVNQYLQSINMMALTLATPLAVTEGVGAACSISVRTWVDSFRLARAITQGVGEAVNPSAAGPTVDQQAQAMWHIFQRELQGTTTPIVGRTPIIQK